MNYIDIAVIALLGLSLLLGLCGKAPKKFFKLIIVLIAVALAYFLTGTAVNFLGSIDSGVIPGIGEAGKSIIELLCAKIVEVIEGTGMNIPTDSITSLAIGLVQVVVFWVLAIALLVVLGIIGGIISAIVFRHAKKHSAVKTLGLVSVIKNAVLIAVLLFPIFVLSPVLKQATALSSYIDAVPVETLQTVEDQANGSKILALTDKALASNKIQVVMYEVEDSEGKKESRSVYQTVGNLPSLLKVAASLSESEDPIAAFTSMSDDEIKNLFNDPVVQEVVAGVVSSMAEDAGLDIDLTGVDLSQEADTFIALKDLKSSMDAGEEFTEENMDNLVDALANSELVGTLAESNPGMLADVVDESTKNEIENALADKVTDGSMTEEEKEALMKLFGTTSD